MFNISPIDGRYNNLTKELNFIFSEYSFIKQRVIIEIQYFLFPKSNHKLFNLLNSNGWNV